MLQTHDLENLIYHTVDLAPPCDNDSVVFGSLKITDNALLVDTVMQYVTRFYDRLLQTLPLTAANRTALQMQRCFTAAEYTMLFAGRQSDFSKPIFKTLLITNQSDKLLFTSNRTADDKGYHKLLKSWSEVHNSVLNSFLYDDNVSATS